MLKVSLLLGLFGLFAAAAVQAQTPPSFGNQLYIKGVVRLPYAGIIEPFESWFDTDKMRADYYGGLDSYIFRGDLNVTWQVNPVITSRSCFETDGPVSVYSYYPDTTGFVLQTDAVQVNDQMCDDWQITVTRMNKTSVYDLYISRQNQLPVRYQMMGYDSLIGSHFDLYQVDYINFTANAGAIPAGVFDEPTGLSCGAFPGPGISKSNPLDELLEYYPHAWQFMEMTNEDGSERVVSAAYEKYLKAHEGKHSAHLAREAKEQRLREHQYKKHAHFIHSHQRRFHSGLETYSVGFNFLMDHFDHELGSRRGRLHGAARKQKTNNAKMVHLNNFYAKDLPASVDWRTQGAVTRPQDQGICGSCWSFGSTGAIEGAYFLKYGKLHVFAEQELMDCSWNQGNNACDGGEDFRAYDWIMGNGGISFKSNYGPYLMQDSYCQASQHVPDASINYYVNTTSGDETALMDALASVGPVSISIDASHPGLSFYTGGVYYDPACKNDADDLDHSVLAVGYGTDPVGGDYWIVKNSWSTYWGDGGFIKMSRTNNNCGVATAPTYVVLN